MIRFVPIFLFIASVSLLAIFLSAVSFGGIGLFTLFQIVYLK